MNNTQNTLKGLVAVSAMTLISVQSGFALNLSDMNSLTSGASQGSYGNTMNSDDNSMNSSNGNTMNSNGGTISTQEMGTSPKGTKQYLNTQGARDGSQSSGGVASAPSSPIDSHRFANKDDFQVEEAIDDSNIDTEGDLWTESDVSIGNADHTGDIAVIGDLDIGNADINGNVYVRGKFTLGNGTIKGNVVVEGDFEAGNGEVDGYVFVTGNLNAGNTDFKAPVYVYGKKSELDNGESGPKLKIAGGLSSGNMNRKGTIYVFGKKSIQNASGKAKTLPGLLGKIDPFLLIDLPTDDLQDVKAIVAKYDADIKANKASLLVEMKAYKAAIKAGQTPTNVDKIESLKASLLDIVPQAFIKLTPFVEGMDFDKKGMTDLQAKELSVLKREAGKYTVKK